MAYHAGFLESPRPDSFLADELRATMASHPRALPPALAFDPVGHALFARVTSLPRYTHNRAEADLLEIHGREIMSNAGRPEEIVELQAGPAVQARTLLRDVERYVVVEPCRPVLDDAVDGLEAAFPRLKVRGIVGDPAFGIAASPKSKGPRLVLLLGSYLGRFDATMARLELTRLRGHLEPGDRLLIGIDLSKPARWLADAYDDSTDVYLAFVRNALRRANREVGTDFRSVDWRLVVESQPEYGRAEIRFEARKQVAVAGGRAGKGWEFSPDEPLIVEHAYKPSEGQVTAIVLGAGLRIVQSWKDSPDGYGLFMLAP